MTSGLASAQQNENVRQDKPTTVNERRENQQHRIAQGVRSGQLTADETSRLETRESRLNHKIRADLYAHNGHLSAPNAARSTVSRTGLSKSIYRDKHNDARQR